MDLSPARRAAVRSPSLRKAILAGAVAAGGLGAAVGALALLFRAEGRRVRKLVGHRLGDRGPDADTLYRPEWGDPLHLVMVGDSLAGSLGASTPAATLGASLATFLAWHANRAVQLHTFAVVGAKSADVPEQLEALEHRDIAADITVVIVGGNDITGRVPLAESVTALRHVIERLQALGSEVVVGTCPDFDTLPGLPPPLREVSGQMSRRLAVAQFKTAAAAGAHPALLGRTVRQILLADPADMFSIDRFHPSSLGYESASLALLPAVREASDAVSAAHAAHPPKPASGSGVPPLRPATD